jgi:hypothetical protein
MEKRKIIFGSYDTARDGLWTLTGWSLSAALYRENYVTIPGRDGDLDLSAALTDGEPRYGSRTLTATFESSEGTRLERENIINTMINWLDGWRMNIVLPDDPDHYVTGRVRVQRDYNDPAHAAVTVTAVCDPWKYLNRETTTLLIAGPTTEMATLPNYGRKTVVPVLTISGEGANVLLAVDGASWALGPGVYQLPDLTVPQGGKVVNYSGTGELSFVYREAQL